MSANSDKKYHVDSSQEGLTFGQILADRVATSAGSWMFILSQLFIVIIWMWINTSFDFAWDPYPFILLNLCLSFQASYSTPVIMMSQNRSAETDRYRASSLNEKVDQIRLSQFLQIWEAMKSHTDEMLHILHHITRMSKKLKRIHESQKNCRCPHCGKDIISNSNNNSSNQNSETESVKIYSEVKATSFSSSPVTEVVEIELMNDIDILKTEIQQMRRQLSSDRLEADQCANDSPKVSTDCDDALFHALPEIDIELQQNHVSKDYVQVNTNISVHEGALKPQNLSSDGRNDFKADNDSEEDDDIEWKEYLKNVCIQPKFELTDGENVDGFDHFVNNKNSIDQTSYLAPLWNWWLRTWRFLLFRNYIDEEITFGERVAQILSDTIGSWTFTCSQTFVLVAWILVNIKWSDGWDPYPFILLNLTLSAQAAFAAPLILMSQNRQGDVDRKHADAVHHNLDHIRLNQMLAVGDMLSVQGHLLDQMSNAFDKIDK